MSEKIQKYSVGFLFLFVGICGFIYVALRSYFIQITHDEANSFFLLYTNYWKAIVGTANTHWLNSFFMKINMLFLGNEVWMIRLQSVLAFPFYTYFLYRIAILSKNISTGILLISLFIINPYLLEYFSLARGYGLSLAFFMAFLYYILAYLNDETLVAYVKWALAFGIVSLSASLTGLFQFTFIFLFVFGYVFYKQKKLNYLLKKPWKGLLIIYIITVLASVSMLLLYMILSDDLHYGGDVSFITDTLGSMIYYMIYFLNLPLGNKVHINGFGQITYFIFIFICSIGIWALFKKHIQLIMLFFVFIFSFFANNLSFILFKTPFPFGRTALLLFVIVAMLFILAFDTFIKSRNGKLGLSIVVAFLMLFNFTKSASLSVSHEWPMQSTVIESFDEVIRLSKNDKTKPKLLIDGYIYAVWRNYYSQVDSLKYNFPVRQIEKEINYSDSTEVEKLMTNQDYIMITERFYNKKLKENKRLEEIQKFESSGLRLIKIKN